MLTDAQPRKARRASFLESDRIRTLDLPQDGRLPSIAKSIESAMKCEASGDVRRLCAQFLTAASEFYQFRVYRSPHAYTGGSEDRVGYDGGER